MHVVIVGNGISGITTARWIRKLSDHTVTVISSETEYFYSRTALMYIYMGHMRHEDTQPYENWFWEKNRIDLVKDHVDMVDFNTKKLSLTSGKEVSYDKLVFALGSKSNKFGWPGQDLKGVSGLYNIQDLEEMEAYSTDLNRAVVVGGGLIGIEMAEMFASRKIPVTMLVREKSYWDNVLPPEEAAMVTRHIREHHFDLRLETNLKEIIDNGKGAAGSIITAETGETIECGFVGLTPGVSPNVSFLKETDLNINRGIIVDEQLQTNMEGVYAIGDCAELSTPPTGRRSIEAVWYVGRMMGETCAYNICGNNVAYDPGIWFNSAKFLDIEYQVYGTVINRPPENHKSLYWEHEEGRRSVRIVYDQDDKSIIGFNLMGIRFRHEVCEKWLEQKTHVEEVLRNLELANFDPELYKTYEKDVVNQYNKINGTSIQLSEQNGLNKVLNFLSK